MELKNGGRHWMFTEEDERYCMYDAQKALSHRFKSIWGTDGCERCGACCYYLGTGSIDKPQFEACKHLSVENNMARCGLHGDGKPKECAAFLCGKHIGHPAQRYVLMCVARDILQTRTQADIEKVVGMAEGLS